MSYRDPVKKLASQRKYRAANKEKISAYGKAYRLRNKEKCVDYDRRKNLKVRFNMTLEDYNRMFVNQKGFCATCGRHQTEVGKTLQVDHCHKTGQVRGLLCFTCNAALGNVKDNTNTLKNMIKYLEEMSNDG